MIQQRKKIQLKPEGWLATKEVQKTDAWPVYCDRPIQRGQIKIRLGGGMNNLMRPFLNRPVFSSTAGWDLAQ